MTAVSFTRLVQEVEAQQSENFSIVVLAVKADHFILLS